MAIRSDDPIRRNEDDALGRLSVARSFARQVLGLDASEGVVVGVLGPWGSGKTSFVNLACNEVEAKGVPVLGFNPWMFSGAEQLVQRFFVELSAQLRIRPGMEEIGRDLADYGDAFSGMGWVPVVGPWIDRVRVAMKIIAKFSEHQKDGVLDRRSKLRQALAKLNKPIIVVVDDIDRLTTPEIRDIFKLVRLTASFPNMIYLLAFDRQRVEEALSELGVPGRAYLEKILQIAIDLPAIPEQVLSRQILSTIDEAVAGIERPGPFDEKAWPDLFAEIIRPLIRNMRDVRRYAAAVKGTVTALDGQIALVDVLSLEAFRVFLPDVFSHLHGAVEGLTSTTDFGMRGDPPRLKAEIEGLITASRERRDLVRKMIEALFPAAARHVGGSHYGNEWMTGWLRDRRVAHEEILRLYLERVEGEGLKAFADAERAWACFGDRESLNDYLRSLDRERLQDVIASLGTYEDQFKPVHVVPGLIVLLNLQSDIPKRQRGMLELDTRFTVSRVTFRLLRSLGSADAAEATVRQALPELTSLSSKLELILQVGHRENIGHKLVSENAAKEFEKTWREEVRSAPAERLLHEWDLLGVVFSAKCEADPSEPAFNVENSPAMTLAMLRASQSEVMSQTLGSRAVRRFPRLNWDALIRVFGDEAALRQRVDDLRATNPRGADDLLVLADKYLGGWRPSRFDDE